MAQPAVNRPAGTGVPDASPAEPAPASLPAAPGALASRQDHVLIEQALSAIVADIGALDLPVGRPGGDAALAGDPAVTIARQVADMAQGLAALADRLVGQAAVPPDHGISEGDCIAFLETQFRIRRLRGRHLPGLALGEPAWDMLLDLSVAHYWRRETSVTSLCIAADVPSTTALRWINSMTKAGLIVRRPCQRDGRRSFLAIAPDSYAAMLALAADALRTEQRVRSRYQRRNAA
ncbi:hypothetical protein CAP39_09980 [Sphingomonas sp. IBVSS1]|nr:hypothetical protein CAP39_09980 [Sphingomonas sp. IBVSS1]